MLAAIFLIETFFVSIGAGIFGALLGLGGGVILVPILTLALGIDIHYAIGASIVSVIATSSDAAAAYLRDGVTNIRVAMFLEIGTTLGAIFGAFMAGFVGGPGLFILFGLVLTYSAYAMVRRGENLEHLHLRSDDNRRCVSPTCFNPAHFDFPVVKDADVAIGDAHPLVLARWEKGDPTVNPFQHKRNVSHPRDFFEKRIAFRLTNLPRGCLGVFFCCTAFLNPYRIDIRVQDAKPTRLGNLFRA